MTLECTPLNGCTFTCVDDSGVRFVEKSVSLSRLGTGPLYDRVARDSVPQKTMKEPSRDQTNNTKGYTFSVNVSTNRCKGHPNIRRPQNFSGILNRRNLVLKVRCSLALEGLNGDPLTKSGRDDSPSTAFNTDPSATEEGRP